MNLAQKTSQANQAGETGVDVDVLFGVTGQRQQQFLHRHFMHNNAVGLRFDLCRRRRHQRRHACGLRNRSCGWFGCNRGGQRCVPARAGPGTCIGRTRKTARQCMLSPPEERLWADGCRLLWWTVGVWAAVQTFFAYPLAARVILRVVTGIYRRHDGLLLATSVLIPCTVRNRGRYAFILAGNCAIASRAARWLSKLPQVMVRAGSPFARVRYTKTLFISMIFAINLRCWFSCCSSRVPSSWMV